MTLTATLTTTLIEAPSDEQEQRFLIRSMCDTMIPKLVQEDISLLQSLILDVFPGADIQQLSLEVTLRPRLRPGLRPRPRRRLNP